MPGQQKKSLNTVIAGCYIFLAITVLMVGRRNPLQLSATTDAACVFFVVATFFAIERQIMAWCMPFSTCRAAAVTYNGVHHTTMSMVAQAGQSSDWPVSDNAGIPTPVWAIASECRNSSDSMIQCYRRLPLWLRPQQKNTQNPRSTAPNSATTAAVRFSALKIFHSGYTLTMSVLRRWLLRILFMPFPTSTMILRL
ncbi:TPA: ash family protein [Salmonella enterica subsp. enterica serovar Dublin]|nr:ash family protein [Salmonella enterica subsp. enterica serovar Dublin]